MFLVIITTDYRMFLMIRGKIWVSSEIYGGFGGDLLFNNNAYL